MIADLIKGEERRLQIHITFTRDEVIMLAPTDIFEVNTPNEAREALDRLDWVLPCAAGVPEVEIGPEAWVVDSLN
jgi:hypothetical protein